MDVVLFEGWMLGFQPLSEVQLPVYTNATAESAESLAVDAKDGDTAVALAEEEKQRQHQQLEIQEAYTKARDVKVIYTIYLPRRSTSDCGCNCMLFIESIAYSDCRK